MANSAGKAKMPFGRLVGNAKYSDLTLECEGQEILAHKSIVCEQSTVIDKAVNNEDFIESKLGRLNMDYFDLDTVKRMVDYMYTGSYTIGSANNQTATVTATAKTGASALNAPKTREGDMTLSQLKESLERLETANSNPRASDWYITPAGEDIEAVDEQILEEARCHLKVNEIADYYELPGLQEIARSHIKELFSGDHFPVATFAAVVHNAEANNMDPDLHQILASFAADHLHDLVAVEKFAEMDFMNERFGGQLVRTCANLLEWATDRLKFEEYRIAELKKTIKNLQGRP